MIPKSQYSCSLFCSVLIICKLNAQFPTSHPHQIYMPQLNLLNAGIFEFQQFFSSRFLENLLRTYPDFLLNGYEYDDGFTLQCPMLCRKTSVQKRRGSVAVHLNVYDLTSINGYAYWLGLGVYHSGVQVHEVEYAFGAHEYPTTGIFEGDPKQCDGFRFRKSILIGWTEMSAGEVRGMMEKLSEKYRGDSYNLITNNCNHFCNDACIAITGNPIPSWVNRLARIGLLCHCIIPVNTRLSKVSTHKIDDKVCEVMVQKTLTSRSNQLLDSPSSSSESSCSPPWVTAYGS